MFGTAPIAVLPPVAPAMGIHSVPSPAPYPYYYGQSHQQALPPQPHSAPQTTPCSCPECWSYYNSNYYYQQPQQQQQPKRLSLSSTSSYAHNPYMPVVTEDVVLTPPTPLIATPTVPQAFSSTNTTRMTNVNFNNIVGNMVEMAKTSHGSSYIQACLREYNVERFHAVCNEILPHAMELLIDTHGCYVVRTLMEQMAREDLAAFVKSQLSKSEAVVLELCTASLHSRRIVQFLLETLDATSCEFMVDLVMRKCSEISRTQQGCIVVQRVLDRATIDERKTIFDIIQRNVVSFAMDPYANYVVQYMFENGDKESNSQCIFDYFVGNVISLACDKYASNVVEKALHFTTQEAQHAIVEELYSVEDAERLVAMIQDSYGNYIIQSTIALCSFRDVWMIAEKLNPVLMNTPYGYKIASKLERRLKGKALGSA